MGNEEGGKGIKRGREDNRLHICRGMDDDDDEEEGTNGGNEREEMKRCREWNERRKWKRKRETYREKGGEKKVR